MDTLGLRELRQHASDLVRRAEAGEHLLITVAGRPAAVLGPPERDHWRRYEDVADLLIGTTDDEWDEDRELIDDQLTDPWERHQ
ncbi:type II toxin-antitoxin system Phd/YefM family antitoxin [Kribbella catacumbae]|uniref:type II toxin-antitoxin system Phd/YefM family antitoxin n=1 Tax=Kribbella catacumbae TaxID=460086 RepID=UPI000399F2A4|nr:type II toxin-antitoxin system prevent-host-death family antitoxin [Kribbella catacumbae]